MAGDILASALVPDGARHDRLIGAFVGLAVGDALGTTLEFKSRDSYPPLTDMVGGGPFGLPPGAWTDDMSMALCLADSLLAKNGDLDPHDLMSRFVRWWRHGENSSTGVCFDIGITIREALARFERTGDPLQGSNAPDKAGNGSIMRLAPVVLRFGDDPDRSLRMADLQGIVTHAAPACRDACTFLAALLLRLADGDDFHEAVIAARGDYGPEIRAITEGSYRVNTRDQIRSSGYVVHTLEAALWAVHHAQDAREALLLAANLGDDADTVAAVTGQIAGARWGLSCLPDAWVSRLVQVERIISVADLLILEGRAL